MENAAEVQDFFSGRIKKYPDYVKERSRVWFSVRFFDDISKEDAEQLLNNNFDTIDIKWRGEHVAEILIKRSFLQRLKMINEVMWIDLKLPSKKDANIVSAQRIHVNNIQSSPLDLDGAGVTIGVWERGNIGQHQDLDGRVVRNTTLPDSNHATHVTGTIAGNGSLNPSTKGMAPGSLIRGWSWADNPNEITTFGNESSAGNIEIANWSFGYLIGWEGNNLFPDIFGSYHPDASSVDDIVSNYNKLLFKSAGNDRNDCNPQDPNDCDGDPDGYRTISSVGSAKNILTIGATTDADTMTAFSSWGPTNDNRIKPDLCANGDALLSTLPNNTYGVISGTSMSTPSAAGAAALLYQHYKNKNGIFPDDSSIIKGVMIHTANDFGTTGPDAQCGWGLINAKEASDIISDNSIWRDSISQNNSERTFQFYVPMGTPVVKTTLVWTDPEAVSNASVTLVNNLDLRLIDPNGIEHLPWVLNSADQYRTATVGDNDRDNIEQVVVNNPASGIWTVKVINDGIPQGSQNFVVIYDDLGSAPPSGTPVIDSPDNGDIVNTSTPSLVWQSTGASSYSIQLTDITGQILSTMFNPASGGSGCADGSGTCTKIYPNSPFADGAATWTVTDSETGLSDTASFTINTESNPPLSSIPDECQNSAPANGLINEGIPLCIEEDGSGQAQMSFFVESADVGKTLLIRTGYGTGEGSILHKYGSRPSLPSNYDYASNDPDTTDTLSVPNVQQGWNYIHFSTDTSFSGVTMLVEYSTSNPPPSSIPDECQNSAPANGLINEGIPLCIEEDGSGQAQMSFFVESVDVGKTLLIQTGHGTGEGSILHKYGSRPSLPSNYDYASNDPDTMDTLSVPNVQQGWNYIHFSTDTSFSGVTMLVEYQ